MRYLLLAPLFLCGCYTAQQYPLQPGELVTFRDQLRANEYRQLSGNDITRTGRVVTITRPTQISTE
jgi:hypothetical protein